MSETSPQTGILHVRDTILHGALLVAALDLLQFTVFYLAPVVALFAPLIGFTQWVYIAPIIVQTWMEGDRKAATGMIIAALAVFVISLLIVLTGNWGEDAYFSE